MNNDETNILFIGNGSNSNRGCEAIIRGTIEVLTNAFGKVNCTNIYNIMQQEQLPKDDLDKIVNQKPKLIGYKNLFERIIKGQLLRFSPYIWEKIFLGDIIPDVQKADIVLSVGGDNYSMDYGLPRRFIQQGKLVKRMGKPLVIFGASVGPFDNAGNYKSTILSHLRNEVDMIMVRENRSYNYLVENGCNNVIRVADPAFLMPPSKPHQLAIPSGKLHDAIGLNISPLVAKQNHQGKDNPAQWIKDVAIKLEAELQRPVILLYHVTTPHTNDYELLAQAHDLLENHENIFLLEVGLNAAELKWVISKLSCLIGARTHATIAGFSSCVPTISLAYSVKAWGINEDLFGHAKYVLPAPEMSTEDIVFLAKKVLAESDNIRSVLSDKMTLIKEQAYSAGDHLRRLVEHKHHD